MNKTVKNSIMIVIICILAFAIIGLVYENIKEKPVDSNAENTDVADENTGLDNVINELFDDAYANELTDDNNEIANETKKENEVKNEQIGNIGSSTQSATSKEKKAVELVEKAWGGSEGVYFSNDGIDNQGRYRVSVHKKNTTDTLAFFIVDLERELVTKQ